MAKLLLLVIIFISIEVGLNACKMAPAALFIFGDSYFDPGNNNYINTTAFEQANFPPYGETYFGHPTGRFSNGRLISDFLAEKAGLQHIPPYLQPNRTKYHNYHGVNFASGGAGALPRTLKGSVISLETQLEYYNREVSELSKRRGHAEAAKILSTAVYMVSIGTNDYISPFFLKSNIFQYYTHSQYVDMVIGNLSMVVKGIYKLGGRKFMFLNLGELGCLPGIRILKPKTDVDCLKDASDLGELHNKALSVWLSKMEAQMHGFKYFVYDFKSNVEQRRTQPSKHGFKEGDKACCGTGPFNGLFSCGGTRPLLKNFTLCENPNEYVFWDSYHPTEIVNKQMADQMWAAVNGPNTLNKLFLCV